MEPRDPTRCIILSCGNPLRGDDGVGPRLAAWAEERFRDQPEIRVISRQQWTPELAQEISRTDSVVFIDSSIECGPGEIRLLAIEPAKDREGLATHHLHAAQLLAIARELFGSLPSTAVLLTVGAAAMELSEELSEPVKAAMPEACTLLEKTIRQQIAALEGQTVKDPL